MINIDHSIRDAVVSSIKELYDHTLDANEINIKQTPKEFNGDLTIVCFPFTKFSKQPPDKTATELSIALLKHVDFIDSTNVEKGFLNITLSDPIWNQFVHQHFQNEQYGIISGNGPTIMIEYCAPNTNKPIHLGHIRNCILGYSLGEILRANGFKVVKVNLINDRGIHICKSMLAWQKWGNGETPESSGLKGDKLVGNYYVKFETAYREEVAKMVNDGMDKDKAGTSSPLIKEAQEMLRQWEAGDKEVIKLWKTMNSWVYDGFETTFNKLGVDFDKNYYESDTYLLGKTFVEEGVKTKAFDKHDDGSVWASLGDPKLDDKLLLRSDGTTVYITQDLGTADLKFADYKMERSIYVVGNEQDYHFKVLKILLEKLKKEYAEGIYHLSYGMVDLPSGKMKSREGTAVDADDLIAEMETTAEEITKELGKIESFDDAEAMALYHTIAMGALKFFLLKVDPKRNILFDPKESIDFQGFTGPFIQYTYARIRSLLAKAGDIPESKDANTSIQPAEKEVLLAVYKYPDIVKEAGASYDPALVANFVYDVAKRYNKFYATTPVLKSENNAALAFRLQLSAFTANILRSGMAMLGIDVPERM